MGKRWSYGVRRVCQSSEKLASKCWNHSEIYRDQWKFGENSDVMQPSTRCSSCGFWSWSIVRESENKKSDSGLIAWTETRPKRSDADRYDQEQITTGMKQDHEGLEVSRSCTLSGSSCKNLPVISIFHLEFLYVYKQAGTSHAHKISHSAKLTSCSGNWRSRIAGVRIAKNCNNQINRNRHYKKTNLHRWPDIDSISRASSFPSGGPPGKSESRPVWGMSHYDDEIW